MCGLKFTVGKVSCQFEVSTDIVRLFHHQLSSFGLHCQTDDVLSASHNELLDLLGLLLLGHDHQ